MFPIELVTEEVNLFVSKELYILKSLLIQFYKDWAVTKPSSQVEEKKNRNQILLFSSTQITPPWKINILGVHFNWTIVRNKS